jgi:hypothetical protein
MSADARSGSIVALHLAGEPRRADARSGSIVALHLAGEPRGRRADTRSGVAAICEVGAARRGGAAPRVCRIAALCLLGLLALGATGRMARAETITVGMFAPSAPFASTKVRLEFVSRLAEVLAQAVGAERGIGRVYARPADFVAAVKSGELAFAVVDAPALAAGMAAGSRVLAIAERRGETSVAWQLVSRGAAGRVLDLKGATVAVPALGGREADFVYHAALGGELGPGFFASVSAAPDAISAVTSVSIGRAGAALVPGDLPLPDDVVRVVTMPSVPLPALVAMPRVDAATAERATAAAAAFRGGDVLAGFRPGGVPAIGLLAGRFARQVRRGPMAIPTLRLRLASLLRPLPLAIERPPLLDRIELPSSAPPAPRDPGRAAPARRAEPPAAAR